MTRLTAKCHRQAFKRTMELLIIGSILTGLGDIHWLYNDIRHNGLHLHYIITALFLLLGTAITIYAYISYHQENVKKVRKKLIAERRVVSNARLRQKRRK